MSPVIVRLINWAATYDEVFIVLVMVVAKAILFFFFFFLFFYFFFFFFFFFFQLLHFITLCDVASIFAVRTCVVSQAFTMVLILIDNS